MAERLTPASARRYAENLAKQVRFAGAVALNRTADEINAALRERVRRQFIIRRPALLTLVAPRELPRHQRATRENLTAIVRTEGFGRIFNPFEEGEPKVGTPTRPVAIPTEFLRPNRRQEIPKRWFPENLGLVSKLEAGGTQRYFALGKDSLKKGKTPVSVTSRGAVQIKGKHRTFVLDPRLHRGVSPQGHGVYVRIGPAREDVRMIWAYRPQVSRPSILGYHSTARAVYRERMAANYQGAFAFALRTAK